MEKTFDLGPAADEVARVVSAIRDDQLDAPTSWEGTATAGGVTMPAPAMAAVALDELVIHGWDLAVATGQPYSVSDADAEACTSFAGAVGESPEERAGLYGP